MENQVAEKPLCDKDVAGPLTGEDLAALIVKDLLTNANSRWLDESSSYILSKDLSKYIAQLMLKDTNFIQALKLADVISKGHTSKVTSIQFSPDGKTIVTASRDKTAKLWDLKGIRLTPKRIIKTPKYSRHPCSIQQTRFMRFPHEPSQNCRSPLSFRLTIIQHRELRYQ